MKRAIGTPPGEATKYLDLSSVEVTERELEEIKHAAEKPMKDWLKEISAADSTMSRQLEDVIDALDTETRANIAPETLSAYVAKKEIRSRKPS